MQKGDKGHKIDITFFPFFFVYSIQIFVKLIKKRTSIREEKIDETKEMIPK